MRKIIITGGAGFIGTNLALDLLGNPDNVIVVYDNLSRKGVKSNIRFLLGQGFKNFQFIQGDIRDFNLLKQVVSGADCVFHLAAQVAVTSSVDDPINDFETNASGTLYLLEACRKKARNAFFLYASTNKVYGDLSNLRIRKLKTRYAFIDKESGISEEQQLDFHSPYGCSKGSGDQYTRDYSRIYNMKTVVLRQSCIYGPFQHGNVDQGWIAHFVICALSGRGITIYGDGKQVRDILCVYDLIRAYKTLFEKAEVCSGSIFNIGGGKQNSFSLLEIIEIIERITGEKIKYSFDRWRPGDQKVFISDNASIKKATGWEPEISGFKGVEYLINWVRENPGFFSQGKK
ncbi:MAG TPA: GDP-mannose 4,6-dehydratase [bacterium]|jgi:CDP-paratose 2-epimerase|nr:GDP-mannose 4,6-dehydratase [bacterium]